MSSFSLLLFWRNRYHWALFSNLLQSLYNAVLLSTHQETDRMVKRAAKRTSRGLWLNILRYDLSTSKDPQAHRKWYGHQPLVCSLICYEACKLLALPRYEDHRRQLNIIFCPLNSRFPLHVWERSS